MIKSKDLYSYSQGVDVNKFEAAFSSFSTNAKIKKAYDYDQTYKLTSAPSFVVNNTYVIDPGLSQTYEGVIKTMDIIINSLKDKSCKPQ